MSLMPETCPQHRYRYKPCSVCEKLATLYRLPEPEKSRLSSVLLFLDEHREVDVLPESSRVFSDLKVDDYSIGHSIQKLTELVWRLAPYPDFFPEKRRLAAQARDFLEGLIDAETDNA